MINTITLNGRLAFENELKKTNSGDSVLSNRLAVERNYKDQDGNKPVDFINVVFWRKTADIVNQYTSKGDLIGVTGRLQTRQYENQSGQRVDVAEVYVNEVQFLQTSNNQNNSDSKASNNYQGNSQGKSYTSQNKANNYTTNVNDGVPVEISEDDLPFDYRPV